MFQKLKADAKRMHGAKERALGGKADAGQDKALIRKAITQHDNQLHDGKKTRLELATGGRAGKSRLDRKGRGAKGKGKTTVNVIVAGGKGDEAPQKPPMPMPMPPMAAGPAGPAMPPPGMGAGAPPPGLPPRPMKTGGRAGYAKGGRIKAAAATDLPGGAGGGLGRLEKAKDARKIVGKPRA